MHKHRQLFHRLRAGFAAIALLAVPAITAGAQSTSKEALVIYKTNGAKVSYVLETKPTVKFGPATVIVESPEISDTHGIADVSYFRFEKVQPSGIQEVDADECRIAVSESAVTIYGLHPGSAVSAADIQGRVIANVSANEAGVASIPTVDLAPGVYVIATADSHTFKIYKH